MNTHTKTTVAKAVALASVVPLLAGALSGCGSSTATAGAKPNVKVMVVKIPTLKPAETLTWTKQLEDACGCSITWQNVENASWDRQKGPSLAAGDVPDLALNAFSPEDASRYPYFEDLSDDLDKTPNLKEYLDKDPYARKIGSTTDGKLFVVKGNRGKGYESPGQHWMINKTWLDKLGLEVPTTWDEFEDVLKAFKTQDPNGNGKADEVPFSLRRMDTGGYGWNGPMLILNSTGITTQFSSIGSDGLYVEDGKVKTFMTDERYKESVQWLHKLMAEGLIPSDSLTKDNSKYQSELKGADGGKTAIVGSTFGWHTGSFGPDIAEQYVSIAAPKADASMPDDEVTWDYSLSQQIYTGGLAVSSSTKHKDAVLKIVDKLFDEKVSVEQRYGTLGEYVQDEGDHVYQIIESKVFSDPVETVPTTSLSDSMAGWIRPDVTIKGEREVERLQAAVKPYKPVYERLDPERDGMPIYVTLSDEERNAQANRKLAIMNYAVPKTANWIVNGGIEDEWDKFVSEVNRVGIGQSIDVWQKAYDEQVK